jgi:hypothetical protein
MRSLEWILPGLSTAVADLDPSTTASCSRLERTLLRGREWSHGARTAASAIALAHALAQDDALRSAPVRTIALADCLHCLAIATLCEGDDSEHERLAARAHVLQPYAAPEIADRATYSGFAEPGPTASLDA